MMSDLQTALKTSGVKLPSARERIWNWIHDHKDQTARQVEIGLKLPHNTASSTINALLTHNKLTRVKSYDRHQRRNAYHYNTTSDSYNNPPKRVNTPHLTAVTSTVTLTQAVPLPRKQTFDIEACTIQELRDLRDRLNRLFEVLK